MKENFFSYNNYNNVYLIVLEFTAVKVGGSLSPVKTEHQLRHFGKGLESVNIGVYR